MNIFYRGGCSCSLSLFDKETTAYDVINYEREELGNALDIFKIKEELSKIPANECLWVTKDKISASYYGEVEEIVVFDYEILAGDGIYGGFLIHEK